jgi:hypothetical protein
MRVTRLSTPHQRQPVNPSEQTIKALKRQTGRLPVVPTRFILRMLMLPSRPQSKFLRKQSGAVTGTAQSPGS